MYSGISMPWLDNEENLYAGIMHLSTRDVPANVAKVDYFRVSVCVPEPSSIIVFAVAGILGLVGRRMQK